MKQYVRNPKSPIKLYQKKDGEFIEIKAHGCGECGSVYKSYDSAIYCCEQQICKRCGKDAPKAWVHCSECSDIIRLENAVEVPYDGGPVYDNDRDKYFESMEDAQDYYCDEEEDAPEYLFPCDSESPKSLIDTHSIIEQAVEDLFEDAFDAVVGIDELDVAVKKFNSEQTLSYWVPRMKEKIKYKAEVSNDQAK